MPWDTIAMVFSRNIKSHDERNVGAAHCEGRVESHRLDKIFVILAKFTIMCKLYKTQNDK